MPGLYGPAGSGKTVLLNEFARRARRRGWFTAVDEVSSTTNVPKLIAVMARDVLLEMSSGKRATARVQRALGVLRAFTSVKAFGIELQIDAPAVSGPADSGDLARDLRGLFVELGSLAQEHRVGRRPFGWPRRERSGGVLLALDEVHRLPNDSLDDLYFALHRTSQESLPLAFVPCGLSPPQGAAPEPPAGRRPESYPIRMVVSDHRRLDPLSVEESTRALLEPAAALGVEYTLDALEFAVNFCESSPWLIQLLGAAAWEDAQESPIDSAALRKAQRSDTGAARRDVVSQAVTWSE